MAITPITLTGNIHDAVGGLPVDARRTIVSIVPCDANGAIQRIVDPSSNEERYGNARAVVDPTTGAYTFVGLWPTDAATNPTGFYYEVFIEYVLARGSNKQRHDGRPVWRSGPFSLTASASMADLDLDTPAVSATWRSGFRTTMEGLRDQAEAARDLAIDISNIDTSDEAINVALQLPDGLAAARLEAAFGPGTEQTQRLMRKLDAETSDASIMVVGDSTGNDTSEWVYRIGQALAADWPAWTVKYRLANDGTSSYDSAITIQTGTGLRTLTIYNASVPGFHALHFQGSRAAWAIFPYDPDLIMISLGHNEASASEALIHSRYVSLTESITERLSGDVILIAQNPATANTFQQTRAEVYRAIASARGFGFIDVQKAFLDTGDAPALTLDGIHPTAAGSALWANTVYAAFRYRPADIPKVQPPSTLATPGEELLVDGDFTTLPTPDRGALTIGGWWVDANTHVGRDRINYESSRGWAVQVTSIASGFARIGQNIDPNRVRGQWITAAWRVYFPAGTPQTVGWLTVGDDLVPVTLPGAYAKGAYLWLVGSAYIDPAATSVTTNLKIDAGNAAGVTLTIDRASLVVGRFPRAARVTGQTKADGTSGNGSPEGVVTAAAGTLFTRTDVGTRTNEARFPVAATSTVTSGWAATGGALTNPTGLIRNTLSVTSGTRQLITSSASAQPVVAGKEYTVSAQAASSDGLTVQLWAQFYTSGGVATGPIFKGASLTTTSSFASLRPLTMTSPLDAAFVMMRVAVVSGTSTVGGTLDGRRFLLEQAPSAGSYFDGTTAGASWTGAAHGSSSTLPSTAPPLYVKTTPSGNTGWVAVARA